MNADLGHISPVSDRPKTGRTVVIAGSSSLGTHRVPIGFQPAFISYCPTARCRRFSRSRTSATRRRSTGSPLHAGPCRSLDAGWPGPDRRAPGGATPLCRVRRRSRPPPRRWGCPERSARGGTEWRAPDIRCMSAPGRSVRSRRDRSVRRRPPW
ncbi:hypothetical protein CZ771_13740 [Actinomycetales bacterium JB111]|nr:hypothetical protein CZ771_13740 [Actinomycetales bacterium JB111]